MRGRRYEHIRPPHDANSGSNDSGDQLSIPHGTPAGGTPGGTPGGGSSPRSVARKKDKKDKKKKKEWSSPSQCSDGSNDDLLSDGVPNRVLSPPHAHNTSSSSARLSTGSPTRSQLPASSVVGGQMSDGDDLGDEDGVTSPKKRGGYLSLAKRVAAKGAKAAAGIAKGTAAVAKGAATSVSTRKQSTGGTATTPQSQPLLQAKAQPAVGASQPLLQAKPQPATSNTGSRGSSTSSLEKHHAH